MRNPDDPIATAGGDGTVRKIAFLVALAGSPIAVLPLGTATMSPIRPAFAARFWHDGALEKFHSLDVEALWGRRLIEGAGSGALAEFVEEARGKKKPPLLESHGRIGGRVPVAAPVSRDNAVDNERVPGAVTLLG